MAAKKTISKHVDLYGGGVIRRIPVSVEEWRAYLQEYSVDVLTDPDDGETHFVTDVQREQRWLGTEPATDADIAQREVRNWTD